MMGGTLTYESTLGQGTTFRFSILAELAPPIPNPTTHRIVGSCNGAAAEPSPANVSILVVEDNPVSQEVTRTYLERLGYDVAVARNGSEAVSVAKSRRFHAVLMDCQMPEMDGFEATRCIRKQESDAGQPAVPIVALTANAFVEDRVRCLETGMNDYLSKPFTSAALRAMLAKHLGGIAPAMN
jgi:CheY-like chemotaxis protein